MANRSKQLVGDFTERDDRAKQPIRSRMSLKMKVVLHHLRASASQLKTRLRQSLSQRHDTIKGRASRDNMRCTSSIEQTVQPRVAHKAGFEEQKDPVQAREIEKPENRADKMAPVISDMDDQVSMHFGKSRPAGVQIQPELYSANDMRHWRTTGIVSDHFSRSSSSLLSKKNKGKSDIWTLPMRILIPGDRDNEAAVAQGGQVDSGSHHSLVFKRTIDELPPEIKVTYTTPLIFSTLAGCIESIGIVTLSWRVEDEQVDYATTFHVLDDPADEADRPDFNFLLGRDWIDAYRPYKPAIPGFDRWVKWLHKKG